MRDLTGPAQSRSIRDLLQSILALEALVPSQPLWLLSAWITDAPIIDNRARQFAVLDPEWHTGPVTLSAVLETALSRGGRINIITRPHPINEPFVESMRRLASRYENRLRLLLERDFHDKGLLGDDFEIAGSMNFTRKGIETNAEHIILRTTPEVVAERHLELNARWGARFNV